MVDRRLNYGRDAIAKFLSKVAPYENVLDIGAGSGHDLATAGEICPSAARYAIESYPPNIDTLRSQQVEVAAANIERDPLPFAANSLQVVMSNQTLEHVKEIFWILHEASRVLQVGGHLIIGVPNLASLHNRLMLLFGLQPTCLQNASAHVRGYTRHDILRMFQKVFPGGYRLEGFAGSNFYPFPANLAKPLAQLMPNQAWAIFLLLRKTKPYNREFLEFPIHERLETNFYLGEEAARFQHLL
jgi:ubiquinone/menaquinone biosynthesis C-methylase UbiE